MDDFLLAQVTLAIGMRSGSDEAVDTATRMAQADAARSATLPIDIWASGGKEEPVPTILSAWGIVLGEKLDRWTQAATLPEGWKKVPTEHPMWTRLVDARGRRRGEIFQGPFYDRGDFLALRRRFYVSSRFSEDGKRRCAAITDGGKDAELYQSPWLDTTASPDEIRAFVERAGALGLADAEAREGLQGKHPDYTAGHLMIRLAEMHLMALRPQCNSYLAYWDEE